MSGTFHPGRTGLWTFALDAQPMGLAREMAAELEELGYRTVWIPETVGRDPFVSAALLLSATTKLQLATGIASLHARTPVSMSMAWKTLEEAFPRRFLLGIGVSHQRSVEGIHRAVYDKPYSTMVAYLDAMDASPYIGRAPETEPVRALAALGPRMLRLAAERTLGAHPYFVPVEHTAMAREVMGEGSLLMPEQAVVCSSDPVEARTLARRFMAPYLTLPNYVNNLRRVGWGDDDLAGENGGPTDRLVDAVVAWGDDEAIRGRVQDHLDAGADHVCVQVVTSDRGAAPVEHWRRLAPVLNDL